jgi:hypothetical protein
LWKLDLSRNGLSGVIPPELGNLRELVDLDLSDNALIGIIPPELGNLVLLWKLDLSRNGLSGVIPSELGNFRVLRSLDLSDNALIGVIPSELSNLGYLLELDLSDNALTGVIPAKIYKMKTNIASNRFDFSALALAPSHFASSTNSQYSPQDSVGVAKQLSVAPGGSLEYPLEMPDTEGNVYLWYKDGKALEDQTSRILSMQNVMAGDGGEYECRITNVGFPKLTLYSRKVSVRVGR